MNQIGCQAFTASGEQIFDDMVAEQEHELLGVERWSIGAFTSGYIAGPIINAFGWRGLFTIG